MSVPQYWALSDIYKIINTLVFFQEKLFIRLSSPDVLWSFEPNTLITQEKERNRSCVIKKRVSEELTSLLKEVNCLSWYICLSLIRNVSWCIQFPSLIACLIFLVCLLALLPPLAAKISICHLNLMHMEACIFLKVYCAFFFNFL